MHVCEELAVPLRLSEGGPVDEELAVPVNEALAVPVCEELAVPICEELAVPVCEELAVLLRLEEGVLVSKALLEGVIRAVSELVTVGEQGR